MCVGHDLRGGVGGGLVTFGMFSYTENEQKIKIF